MTAKSRTLALFTVAFVCLAGCSSYKVYSLPPPDSEGNKSRTAENLVQPGQAAKVHLKDGTVGVGDVLAVSSDSITLGTATNYGLEKTVYVADEIDRVEVDQPLPFATAIGGAIGVASVLVALIAIWAIAF